MAKKLNPLNEEEHRKLASDLRKAQEILEPYMERLWQAYGVKSKEANQLFKVLNLVSSQLCNSLDNRWYQIPNLEHSPYYDSGKSYWS